MAEKILEILDNASDWIARVTPALLFVVMVLIIPVLTLGWSIFVFLRYGTWTWVTIGMFVEPFEQSEWVGLNWVLTKIIDETWVGFITFVLAFFVTWVATSENHT